LVEGIRRPDVLAPSRMEVFHDGGEGKGGETVKPCAVQATIISRGFPAACCIIACECEARRKRERRKRREVVARDE